LIGSYDSKIALLEQRRSDTGGPSSVNAKGKRVKVGQVKLMTKEDPLAYFYHRLDLEESAPLQTSSAQSGAFNLKPWHERIELIFNEEVICFKFIEVKAISKVS